MLICWRANSSVSTNNNSGGMTSGASSYVLKNKQGFGDMGRFVSRSSDAFVIMRHEFAHSLYGSNAMHTGGAGHHFTRTFMSDVGGWSNLSSHNNNSIIYNAFDRFRMGWKPNANTYYIDTKNTSATEVNADFVYGQSFPGNINEFILRDFASSGDAIRIKLPYMQSVNANTYNQWIWLENHQMQSGYIDHNANTTKGLYAYVQVGKESMTSFNDYPSNYTYPLTGFGNYDWALQTITSKSASDLGLTGHLWGDLPLFPMSSTSYISTTDEYMNPFTGYSHLLLPAYNIVEPNSGGVTNQIYGNEKIMTENIMVNGTYWPSSAFNYCYGDYRYSIFGTIYDAIPVSRKIGLGNNPSPTPVYTYVTPENTSPYNNPSGTDNRKIFFNGISIEFLQQYTNGDIRVRIRWDDFDVSNNTRWCGDIVLNEQVHLLSGKTIKLDQGLTPQKPVNPISFNGVTVFADPTVFSCKNNSTVTCENNSQFIVDNGSTLKLQSGSLFEVKNGATLRIKNNSKLLIEQGGQLKVDDGGLVIIEGSGILEYNGGSINLLGNNSILEINGIIKIGNNATFTFSGNGYIDFKNPGTADNILCGTNSRFTLTSPNNDNNDLVLKISGNGKVKPQDNLERFTITSGKVQIGYGSLDLGCKYTLTKVNFENGGALYVYGTSGSIISNCDFNGVNIVGNLSANGNLKDISTNEKIIL